MLVRIKALSYQCPLKSALQPVLETIKDRYTCLGFSTDIYEEDIIVADDTDFANEANM